MAMFIMHCSLGRRRTELPIPVTREDVLEALERVAPRPNWAREIVVTALPTWEDPTTIRCETAHREPLAFLKRSNARSKVGQVSVYLPPDVRAKLRAEAEAQGVTVSELGYRLIAKGLGTAERS